MAAKPQADAVITVYPFKARVAVFKDFEERCRYYEEVIGIADHGFRDRPANAMASEHEDSTGAPWWSMYLPDDTSVPTIVHECSHIVDFLMDAHGVPVNVENTEIRAYMLADLFEEVSAVMAGKDVSNG